MTVYRDNGTYGPRPSSTAPPCRCYSMGGIGRKVWCYDRCPVHGPPSARTLGQLERDR